MTTAVALLRGINVGGKNTLPMTLLKKLTEDAGGSDVVTFIASGNVVFDGSDAVVAAMPALLQQKILDATGLAVPVVVRTRAALEHALAHNPFVAQKRDEGLLHIMFLKTTPTSAQASSLIPEGPPGGQSRAARSPGDEFAVVGDHIYLCLPSVAKSKLTNAWFDKQLSTTSTGRNWRTAQKLAALCAR